MINDVKELLDSLREDIHLYCIVYNNKNKIRNIKYEEQYSKSNFQTIELKATNSKNMEKGG